MHWHKKGLAPLYGSQALVTAEVSVLIFPNHGRDEFKHPFGGCTQGRAALKGCIDAVGIGVVDLDYLAAHSTFGKTAVPKIAQIFKLRVILPKRLPGRAWPAGNRCRGRGLRCRG